jgi:voltage-gated sodium channel
MKQIQKLVEAKSFQNFILALIILNGITMGLETSKSFMEVCGGFIHIFDKLVITIFTIEILL